MTTHPWLAGMSLATAVLLLGGITAVLAGETVRGSTALGLFPPDAPAARAIPVAWFAGALLGAVLLTVCRTWPMGVTVLLCALAILSLGTAGVLGVLGVCLACALYVVAATRDARTTWITCAVVFGVVAVALWHWQDVGLAEMLLWSRVSPSPEGPAWDLSEPLFSPGRRSASVTLLLALLLLGVATGSGTRARRLHALELVERYDAMARERDQSAALARASERAHIAREMHDIVAHNVSVMVALSDGAGAALDRAPDRSREALRELSRTGREALSDMQRVLGALDPAEEATSTGSRPEPTQTDLPRIVEHFRVAGLPVKATGLEVALPQDTSLRLAVVRIVTESLTNVLRHAPGTPSAEVTVRRSATALEVEILDTGGIRPATGQGAGPGTGRGVPGMRERAALLGGHVDVGPRPGGGWRVHVLLPCSDDDTTGRRADRGRLSWTADRGRP
ncbi:sensor histidine kinase [Oerskovia enterophila]